MLIKYCVLSVAIRQGNNASLTQLFPHGVVAGDEALANRRAHLPVAGRPEAPLLLDALPQAVPGEVRRLAAPVSVEHGEERHGAARAARTRAPSQEALLGFASSWIRRRAENVRGALGVSMLAGGAARTVRLAAALRRIRYRFVVERLWLHYDLGHILHVFPTALVGENANSHQHRVFHACGNKSHAKTSQLSAYIGRSWQLLRRTVLPLFMSKRCRHARDVVT